MIKKISFAVLITLFIAVTAFAQSDDLFFKVPVFKQISTYAAAVPGDADYIIPYGIVNNDHYLRSLELTALAQNMFDFGQYDVAIASAEEAIREARLSDMYVSEQLITEADRLFTWANTSGIPASHPYYYSVSREYYEMSLTSYRTEEWSDAIENAIKSIDILAALQSGNTPRVPSGASLPASYTVRSWAIYGDCLWKIASFPWVYNDASRWPELYEANKARMPQPDNPNLILIDFVINIPGENRSGMWDWSQSSLYGY